MTKEELIGRKFTVDNTIYTIHREIRNKLIIRWNDKDEHEGVSEMDYFPSVVIDYVKNGTWNLLPVEPTYQTVDPTTIKFDFNNIKIRVNSPEESEWIQKAAFANGTAWSESSIANGANVSWTNEMRYMYMDYNIITRSAAIEYFDESKGKEITIQDILNQQAMKQEVIGYELLKDLPGIPKGTKSQGIGTFRNNEAVNTFDLTQLKDTTWFKPIYKAKNVVVKISGGREVKVTKDAVHMNGQGFLNPFHFNCVREFIINGNLVVNGFSVTHQSVTIGCQEFTKEDIDLVYKAIKSLNV